MSTRANPAVEVFERCGYAVIKGLLDLNQDLHPLYSEYGALLDRLAAQWHAEGKLRSAYGELAVGDRFAAVLAEMDPSCMQHFDITLPKSRITEKTPFHLGPAVFNLIRSSRLLDAVEDFIGPEIYSNPMQRVRIKPPQRSLPQWNGNAMAAATPWHQDLGAVLPEADHSDMLTVWIPMTEATPENGCLLVIPGSHKGGLRPHSTSSPGSKQMVALHVADEFIDRDQAVPVSVSPGDVIFLHRNTFHASLPNLSDGTRWSFDLRYNPIGQPTGRPGFPGFIARSRRHPELELTDSDAWLQLWHDCRKRLATTPDLPFYRY